MNREERAVQQMNAAAGLRDGFDDDGRRRGISCGYIGNVERDGRDDRAWGFFRPHPDASQRMIGRYGSHRDLMDAFRSNRGRFLNWARGAIK